MTSTLNHTSTPDGSVVDLFCGAGGLTHGFVKEGFRIAAGVDIDPACEYPYHHNNQAPFVQADVAALTAEDVDDLFLPDMPRILVGCAPCQPFSSYSHTTSDERWELVDRFADLAVDSQADIVSMENVPRLLTFQDGVVFKRLVKTLRDNGYFVTHDVVYMPEYGLPQHRKRLVLLASQLGPISIEQPSFGPDSYPTVDDAIASMPELRAGECDSADRLHRASSLSAKNLKRIRASTPGGTWRDWPPELVTECHRSESGKSYPSVYGRMSRDEPSPTITTQFYGFGNGRFGHPSQDRAISLREGALLQGFPREYEFVAPDDPIYTKTLGRLIGNAVPVPLGQVIARSIARHLKEVRGG